MGVRRQLGRDCDGKYTIDSANKRGESLEIRALDNMAKFNLYTTSLTLPQTYTAHTGRCTACGVTWHPCRPHLTIGTYNRVHRRNLSRGNCQAGARGGFAYINANGHLAFLGFRHITRTTLSIAMTTASYTPTKPDLYPRCHFRHRRECGFGGQETEDKHAIAVDITTCRGKSDCGTAEDLPR